jgi:hypothetical protein
LRSNLNFIIKIRKRGSLAPLGSKAREERGGGEGESLDPKRWARVWREGAGVNKKVFGNWIFTLAKPFFRT